MKREKDRILAFTKASIIDEKELENISGGSSRSTTEYTTKQTIDNMGNYDTGVDVRWD